MKLGCLVTGFLTKYSIEYIKKIKIYIIKINTQGVIKMRQIIGQLFLVINLVFSSLLLGQITVPNGYYSGTWAGDTTYLVTGDIYVEYGDTPVSYTHLRAHET